MGCGKSTAARMFKELGFQRVDADEVIRDSILKEPEVVRAIVGKFGEAIVCPEGTIDRAALGRAVFADERDLRWLEDLLHPRLFSRWREMLVKDPEQDWIFEVPLLFEKGLENWFDFTLCVATTSAYQFARLLERGMSHALAEQRISKQLPLAQKLELADIVLLNDGSPIFLRDQIAKLVAGLGVRR